VNAKVWRGMFAREAWPARLGNRSDFYRVFAIGAEIANPCANGSHTPQTRLLAELEAEGIPWPAA